jgi:hypothetical protein
MKSIGSNHAALLANARDTGIVPIDMFWITVKRRDNGDPVNFGLWTGDDTADLDVISGTTGLTVSRTYHGGVNLDIPEIPRVSDLTIQSVDVSFSAIAEVCKSIVFEHDPRLAKVEIHSAWLDPASRLLVDPAEIDFLGEVDGAPVERGAVGGESMVRMTVVSDAIRMLTRRNPRKRSFEAQKRRSGCKFAEYSNAVGTWRVFWGEKEVGTNTGEPTAGVFGS